jgi:hypothetical protein
MDALRAVPQRWPLRKLVSAGAVAVLHLLIFVLWLLPPSVIVHRAAPRETILYLAPLPKPPPPKLGAPPRAPQPSTRIAPLPDTHAIIVPLFKDDALKGLPGLGRSLFACRPENIANLSPEEQAACASASNAPKPSGEFDFRDRSDRVPGAASWVREKARKNAPMLAPCASPHGVGVGLGTVLCLGNALVNGVKPDEQPIYGDKEDEAHVPNNGDPHPEYTDPDH